MTGPHPAVAAVRLAVRAALGDARTRCPRARGVQRRRRLAGPGRGGRLRGAASRASRAGARHRRPRPAGRLGRPAPRGSPRSCAALGARPGRGRSRVEVAAGRGPRGRRPRGALRRARARPPSGSAPRWCCSATPATTRPRRCCSAWPAAPAPGRSSGMPAPARAASAARCSASPAPRPRPPAAAEGLEPWEDPHNADPAYTRVRARRGCCRRSRRELGPGVAAALARTADQLREDADHLDGAGRRGRGRAGTPQPWPVEALAGLPRAVRTRVWRRLLVAAGAPGRPGRHPAHRRAATGCVTDWHGQGPVHAARRPAGGAIRRSGHHRRPPIGLTRHRHPPAPHATRSRSGRRPHGSRPRDVSSSPRSRSTTRLGELAARDRARTTRARTCCSSASSRAR